MTCREAIDVLADYLDAALGPAAGRELDAHLAECEECRTYLATYRRTMATTAAAARVRMPDELRRRLTTFLLERLRDSG
jgi:anti-sigma factor RsiW